MKYFKWTMPVVLLTGWQILIGSIPVVLGAFLFEDFAALGQISWKAMVAMVYVIIFPMLFCHWTWFFIVSIFPAGVAAIGTLAIPVVGVVSSGIVLAENIGLQELSALVVIVTALGIVLFGNTEPSKQ
jgi:drug/metabolite transporter (DMT)-like permease